MEGSSSGLLDYLGFGIACVGATLGVINTLHLLDQRRVKIRVRPKLAWNLGTAVVSGDRSHSFRHSVDMPGTPMRYEVEVTNLSVFPITVSEVGFGRHNKESRAPIYAPGVSGEREFPVRLEPRQSATLSAGWNVQPPEATWSLAKMYVVTDCGTVKYGTSPILKDQFKSMRAGMQAETTEESS